MTHTPIEILKKSMMPEDKIKCCSKEWCGRYHNEEFNFELTYLTIKLLEGIEKWSDENWDVVDSNTIKTIDYNKFKGFLKSQLSEIKKI